MKLKANSAYGKVLFNKTKHANVYYTTSEESQKLIKNPLFRGMKLPIQIGVHLYQISKLRMLQFYYDLLNRVIPCSRFELGQTDTDSLHFGLSTPLP